MHSSALVTVTKWQAPPAAGRFVFETEDLTPAERRAYSVLAQNGISGVVKAVDQKNRRARKSSPDLIIGTNRWELKCPDGDNPKKTISRNLNKARRRI